MGSSPLSDDSSRVLDESPEASIENEENTNKLNIVRGGRKRTPKEGGTKKYEPVKKTKHLMDPEVAKGLVPCACGQECFKKVPFDVLKACRKQFWSKGAKEQHTHLKHELMMRGVFEHGVFKFKYAIFDTPVCSRFFEKALPISHQRLSTIRSEICSGEWTEGNGNGRNDRADPITARVEEFIRKYAADDAEAHPVKKDVFLSQGISKEDVYISFLTEEDEERTKDCSLSWFYKVWNDKCHHIKTTEWKRFRKCSTCANIRTLKSLGSDNQRGNQSATEAWDLVACRELMAS